MNNKDKEKIKGVLNRIKDVVAYIEKEDIFICKIGDISTEKENKFINCEGKQLTPLNKKYGSNLAQIYNSVHDLNNMLIEVKIK